MSTLMSQARSRVPRFAEAAVERARLSVVPGQVVRAPRAPFAVLVLGILVAGVVGLLMFNTHMQQASFYATSLQQRADALTAQQQSLDMDLERLRDPQRLAHAGRQLGLVVPAVPSFVRLSDGAVLGTPTAATPDDGMRIKPFPVGKPASLRPAPLVIRVPAAAQPGNRPATRPAPGPGTEPGGHGRASAGAGTATGTNGSQTSTLAR